MDIMANLPRVEITDKALKVLKIETAISGLNQKEALEALILRGASSRTLELVEEKDKIPQMALMEVEELERKEKIPVIPDKSQVDKMECKKEGEAIICAAPQVTPEAREALSFILSELEAGREPTSREAADKVGLTPTGLGMILSKVGIKAQNTRRDMKSVKIFTRPMKARIKGILEKE